ncbi:DUF885 family protein [Brevundimonas sp. 2R-24]|uniref:DUF885 family protein n=1 Tax=Peiella sedimenti TaxID=3061083 RepID=A0ABT8SH22_9CAUL|nr:DUF885 family protein [Caulobacteraceae bacterium XZ-24]
MTRIRLVTSGLILGLALGAPLASEARAQDEAQAAAPSEASARLADLIREYDAWLQQEDPLSAGEEGDDEAQARLPDPSREHELATAPVMQQFLDRVQAIEAAGLNEQERLNHAFLVWSLSNSLEGVALDASRLGFDSEGGPDQYLAYVAQSSRITNAQEAEWYLQRLRAAPDYYAQRLANVRRGHETGLMQSALITDRFIELSRAVLATPIADDPLMAPLRSLPASIPADRQAALRAEAEALVSGPIRQARQQWLDYVVDEYRPAAPQTLGVGDRPGGRELYAWLARGYTTTDLTPDQIHQIGLDEVARIRAEMEVQIRETGFTGTFAEFLTFLRTDPRFYAQTHEDLLEKASEMAKRADDGLPALFGTLPRLPYGVRPVPAEIEANYTTGRYFPGSMAQGRAGGYMVNTSRLDQRPLYELPALTLHEAVPGHHLQIALQQEAGEQPFFRRNANVTAYTEGWGLYSEWLGVEMGFYRDPYERFGKLSYEMWRACRLVADTGIHWLGWDLEQARACFRDNSALAPHNIETELERYVSWPGQALGYKIGELRLRELRARAEQRLGDRFDVRAFHDLILVDGPLPLSLLEQRVDAWIAARAEAS